MTATKRKKRYKKQTKKVVTSEYYETVDLASFVKGNLLFKQLSINGTSLMTKMVSVLPDQSDISIGLL